MIVRSKNTFPAIVTAGLLVGYLSVDLRAGKGGRSCGDEQW